VLKFPVPDWGVSVDTTCTLTLLVFRSISTSRHASARVGGPLRRCSETPCCGMAPTGRCFVRDPCVGRVGRQVKLSGLMVRFEASPTGFPTDPPNRCLSRRVHTDTQLRGAIADGALGVRRGALIRSAACGPLIIHNAKVGSRKLRCNAEGRKMNGPERGGLVVCGCLRVSSNLQDAVAGQLPDG
jgi:hypothetical protein